MNIVISRFGSDDASSAAAVWSQFARHPPPLDRLGEFLANDAHYFLAASLADAWVELAYAYELPRPDGAAMLFLYSLDVHPDYRRRGVATALLSFLRRIVAERGLAKLFVIADCANEPAVALYRATGGLVEHGESLCFVYPSQEKTG